MKGKAPPPELFFFMTDSSAGPGVSTHARGAPSDPLVHVTGPPGDPESYSPPRQGHFPKVVHSRSEWTTFNANAGLGQGPSPALAPNGARDRRAWSIPGHGWPERGAEPGRTTSRPTGSIVVGRYLLQRDLDDA